MLDPKLTMKQVLMALEYDEQLTEELSRQMSLDMG
jgi:hypothetical protein